MKETKYLLIPCYTYAARYLLAHWGKVNFQYLCQVYPNYVLTGRVEGIASGLALFCEDQIDGTAFCILNEWDETN